MQDLNHPTLKARAGSQLALKYWLQVAYKGMLIIDKASGMDRIRLRQLLSESCLVGSDK